MKKLPKEYQIVTKTYVKCTYLPTFAKVVTVVIFDTVVTLVTVVTVFTVLTKRLFSPKTLPAKNFFHQKKLKMWQNTKTEMWDKIYMWHNMKNLNVTKYKNLKFDKNKNVTAQKLNIWQKSKTQNVTKVKNSKCDGTKKSKGDQNWNLKIWQTSKYDKTQKLKKWINSKTRSVSKQNTKKL